MPVFINKDFFLNKSYVHEFVIKEYKILNISVFLHHISAK